MTPPIELSQYLQSQSSWHLLFTFLCKSILPTIFCSTTFNYLQLLCCKRQHYHFLLPPGNSWATESKGGSQGGSLWHKCCFLNTSIDQVITYCLFWALCLISLNSSYFCLLREIHHLQEVSNWAPLRGRFPCKFNLFPPSLPNSSTTPHAFIRPIGTPFFSKKNKTSYTKTKLSNMQDTLTNIRFLTKSLELKTQITNKKTNWKCKHLWF